MCLCVMFSLFPCVPRLYLFVSYLPVLHMHLDQYELRDWSVFLLGLILYSSLHQLHQFQCFETRYVDDNTSALLFTKIPHRHVSGGLQNSQFIRQPIGLIPVIWSFSTNLSKVYVWTLSRLVIVYEHFQGCWTSRRR
jgi:hypothetical protein